MGGSSAQWGAARTACEAEGAFLVTVNSIEENTWVHALCGGGDCWIGGNDLSNERGNSVDGWQWHNGESNGYHNFANGEPNEDGWNNGEDCIHISSWTNGQWNDNGCGISGNNNGGGTQYSYVCEKLLPVTPTPTCTHATGAALQVRHSNTDHSHHRCFADNNEPNGCRCMCADMAFDGTESKAPSHCDTLEGDKTLKTFDSSADWINGTYSARYGNGADAGDAYAAHCKPKVDHILECPAGWTTYNQKCYKSSLDWTGHQSTGAADQCPDGYTWTHWDGGRCYRHALELPYTDSWVAAKNACESEGAFLVTINDLAENTFVSHHLCGGLSCFIGGNDKISEALNSMNGNDWQWHNGESNGYANFEDTHGWSATSYQWQYGAWGWYRQYGTANKASGSNVGNGEDCLQMKWDGKWKDTGCGDASSNPAEDGPLSYVCEKLPTEARQYETLFSDHEKVRIVATVHPARVTTSTMHTTWYGNENSWKINGGCSGNCNGYAYRPGGAGDVAERTHDFVLPAGTHELVLEDSWGDGWSGGYLTLAYENGTEFLSTEGEGFGRHDDTASYECDDDISAANGLYDDHRCKKMTIQFTVEPTIITTATLVTENLKCDWESPFINIDNTGFDFHSIAALDIATNFKEEGHKDSDDSYKVWITACTGLDGGGSCTEQLVHAVYDDTAATAVYHDSIGGLGFNFGSEGAFTCSDPTEAVLTLAECQVAANALAGGTVYVNPETWWGTKGCHRQHSTNEWQFNNNMHGTGWPDHTPICRSGGVSSQVNIGEEHKSYKVRVETNAEGVGNKYFINSVKVNAVCAPI
jgi:hypothetical protein